MCYGKDCKRCSKARECLGQVDKRGYKVLLSKAVPQMKGAVVK